MQFKKGMSSKFVGIARRIFHNFFKNFMQKTFINWNEMERIKTDLEKTNLVSQKVSLSIAMLHTVTISWDLITFAIFKA